MNIDMEFSELLMKRRSTRAFTDKKVTNEQITKMLEAAVRAPNACNMQSWHFYAVTDSEIRAKFSGFCTEWAAAAPVIFVVCTDGEAITSRFGEKAKKFILQDTALAAENLLLCAADMGLNGCFMGAFDADKCRKLLNVPEKYDIVALIPVGEAANEVPPRERKELHEVAEIIGGEITECGKTQPDKFTLKGASLPMAVFDDLNLDHASFNNINLHGAKFTDINMSCTFYGGLTLENSYFGCVNLNNAIFENPSFEGASFKNCTFKDAVIESCNLDGMKIDGIDVAEAIEFYKKNK